MPHDKNGAELAVGDKVTVEAVVKEIQTGEEYCNVSLETSEPMHPAETKTPICLNTRQVVKLVLMIILSVMLSFGVKAQTSTNAPGTFFNSIQNYLTSFNTNLDSTFGNERAAVWTGADSIQGGSVSMANALGISYDLKRFANRSDTNLFSTSISAESVTRNSGIAGTLVSEQLGLGLNIIVHDVKLTGYLDGGYDLALKPESFNQVIQTRDRLYGEVGIRVAKALTTHTYTGVGIAAQFPRNSQVFSWIAGFNF